MKGDSKNAPRILELDVLRGLAATIIFLFHCSLMLPPSGRIFNFGVTGVDLFFMISGFVILLTLNRTRHWKDFVGSRFSKLFPTYWVCVSFTAVLIFLRNVHSSTPSSDLFSYYLGNLTMVQRYLGIPNLDEQYWTLEVELLFYFVMLFIFLVRGLNSIEKIGFAALAFIAFYDILLEEYFRLDHYFLLLDHFPFFFAGILFYKISTEGGNIVRYSGLILCYAGAAMLFNNGGRSMYYIAFDEYLVVTLIYFVLFFLLVTNSLRFIVQKPLIFLGHVSYSFYLIHQYTSTNVVIPGLQDYLGLNFYLAVAIAFCVSLFLAWLVTTYVEEPSVKGGKRYRLQRRTEGVEPIRR